MTYKQRLKAVAQGLLYTTLSLYSLSILAHDTSESNLENNNVSNFLPGMPPGEKIKPELHYNNKSLRIFGENSVDLTVEKEEALAGITIFNKYFGEASLQSVVLMDSPLKLMMLDTSNIGEDYMSFLTYEGLANFTKRLGEEIPRSDTQEKMQKQNIIAHELCHKLLTDYVELKGLPVTKGVEAYGHDRLPDWFDEIAAIMCENKKSSQIKQRAWLKNIIPFSDFFVMENPAMQLIRNQMAQQTLLAKQKGVKSTFEDQPILLISSDETDKADISGPAFYAQTAMFRFFLLHFIGDQVFKDLTTELVQGNDASQWILKQLNLKNSKQLDIKFKEYIDSLT
jgi:hypothetical protein